MKTKIYILFLFVFTLGQSSNAQQSETTLPKVENHLNGELDYANEALNLVQRQANGEEISLGKINKDGTVHFNLPEFDIKALYDSIPLQHYDLHHTFEVNSDCKDREAFAETPFGDVYSQKYKGIYIKKYGIKAAVLEPASDNNNNSSSEYYWFYIDSAITFNEECTKVNYSTGDVLSKINANIKFDKGWNFIEENLEFVKTDSKGDSLVTQFSKIQFTKISPSNKKLKWSLRQLENDTKIQIAKNLHNVTPITKQQFENWAPKKLGNLSLTSNEYGIPPIGIKNKNNIHLTYKDKTQKKEIDLYVVDSAKNPDDLEMINFAYAMENRGKAAKDIKPYVAQYNKKTNAMQLIYKVEYRVFVTASGVNINAEELWDYIQKLKTEKLINN